MDKNTEVVLDFLIPQGPTGPTGPNPPACYVDYNPSSNSGQFFTIKNSKILNSNGEISITDNDTVTVVSGTYEITFCGQIEVNGDVYQTITVSLHEDLGGGYSQPIGNMGVSLPLEIKFIQFSHTQLLNFNRTTNLVAYIANNNGATTTVKKCSLIVKKIETN